jgi:N-acetylmuramoyl-L-alanine amidase
MNKFSTYIFFTSVFVLTVFLAIGPMLAEAGFSFETITYIKGQPASTFFVESTTPESLRNEFAQSQTTPQRKPRILIVPGHDDEYSGTEYLGVREADMTLILGKELKRIFAYTDKFEVIISRDENGYNPTLSTYFNTNADKIRSFVESKKQIMQSLIQKGQVANEADKIYHNTAPSEVSLKLYGINKWANENNIDLVVHIHFNDYRGRKRTSPGIYSGFSIYVPEQQYSNARASKEIAESISKQLKSIYAESNLPKEDEGVVEDQDLIAIGSFNTLDPASVLIEYGYIYEPQFVNSKIRSKVLSELAVKTYIGIEKFFDNSGNDKIYGKYNSALLPFYWHEAMGPGLKNNEAILSLQAALELEGVYPPKGFSKRDCPVSGTYGKCTIKAIDEFQNKYKLSDKDGTLGNETIKKLNELYGA